MPDILSPEGFARVKELFLACFKVPPDEQQQLLDQRCGADEELKQQVWKMLRNQPSSIDALTEVVDPAACLGLAGPGAIIGESIGPYKLMEQLGEGGMGIVYVAEQKTPVRRQVALKVIKPGMDTRQVVARFEAERQALSMMDHPHIARIFDGGSTDQGRPYFVMELVRGVPITDFCDAARLTIRQRLELFIQVCHAVQHAHQKGIIHRDLKPSNILVTRHDETPVPKVIDFGVAKAINQTLTDKTIYTQFSQMIGTPLYMSPEQAELSGLDIDTRSDVYSLGVLLYELLTGKTPFDIDTLQQKGLDELRRLIREEEPPHPSQRISTLNAQAGSTISERRSVDSRRLKQLVRGELDWIVMRALEKDRTHRYQSASALAEDIGRYLRDETIHARSPTYLYRLGKFWRKRRASISVIAISMIVIMVLGANFAWNKWTKEIEQRANGRALTAAMHEADNLQAQRNLRGALDKLKIAQTLTHAGRAASEQVNQIDKRRRELALVVELEDIAAYRDSNSILKVRGFEEFSAADQSFSRKLQSFGIDITSASPEQAGLLIRNSSVSVELSAVLDEWAIYICDNLGEDDPQWQRLLAIARISDPDPVRVKLRDAFEQNDVKTLLEFRMPKKVEALSPGTAVILSKLLSCLGEVKPAIGVLLQAQRLHPGDFWVNLALADEWARYEPKYRVEAIRYYTAAVALRPSSLYARNGLAITFLNEKRHHDAINEFRKMVPMAGEEAYVVHFNLANVYLVHQQYENAVLNFEKAIKLRPDLFQAYNNLGSALIGMGRLSEAEAALRIGRKINPADAMTRANLGQALLHLGNTEEAIVELQEAIRLDDKNAPAYVDLSNAILATGNVAEALAICRTAVTLVPDEFVVWNNLGFILHKLDKQEEAVEAFEKAAKLGRSAKLYAQLGEMLENVNRYPEAISAYRETISLAPDHIGAYTNLAVALAETGQWVEAATAQREVVRLKPEDATSHWALAYYLTHAPEALSRDPEAALKAATVAVRIAPKDGHCVYNLAAAHYRNGQFQKCIDILKGELKLDSEEKCNSLFFLAMAHQQLKNEEEARKAFSEGLVRLKMMSAKESRFARFRQDEASALLKVEMSNAVNADGPSID